MRILSDTGPRADSRLRPIYVMHEDGVTPDHVVAVSKGIAQVLDAAGMRQRIEVHHFGPWRHQNWKLPNGELRPFHSVEWYVERARSASKKPGFLYEPELSLQLYCEPWQDERLHWDVLILKSDMYADGTNYIIGAANDRFAIVSTCRFVNRGLNAREEHECIVTETVHELGHVFGLPNSNRPEKTIEQSLGPHCTNRCVMRQGLVVPRDWQYMTDHRLQHGPFCPTCQRELRQFFCQ